MIHQHQGKHGFSDRRCTNADARIVAAEGFHFDWLAVPVNGIARRANAGSRLDRNRNSNILTGGNSAKYAAGNVGKKPLWRQFVAMLRPYLCHRLETGADFDYFYRI